MLFKPIYRSLILNKTIIGFTCHWSDNLRFVPIKTQDI